VGCACLPAYNCAGYTVNVSRIAPLAQNISQAGFDLLDAEGKPYLLIQPVIQVSSGVAACAKLILNVAHDATLCMQCCT
jgi:hypothetical protein